MYKESTITACAMQMWTHASSSRFVAATLGQHTVDDIQNSGGNKPAMRQCAFTTTHPARSGARCSLPPIGRLHRRQRGRRGCRTGRPVLHAPPWPYGRRRRTRRCCLCRPPMLRTLRRPAGSGGAARRPSPPEPYHPEPAQQRLRFTCTKSNPPHTCKYTANGCTATPREQLRCPACQLAEALMLDARSSGKYVAHTCLRALLDLCQTGSRF